MRPGRTGYSSFFRRPKYKSPKRIVMPGIGKRPLRFQLRSIIRAAFVRVTSPWWLTVHRRGIPRQLVGVDPLEARAVPPGVIKGYLTERLIYAALVNQFHFVPGVDFDFQSSVDGGRLEMGGLVADFLFRYMKIVINPLGPQHYQFRNVKKDEEQVQILAEMGYTCYLIDQEITFDERKLDEFLRRIFGGWASGGGGAGAYPAQTTGSDEKEQDDTEVLWKAIMGLKEFLYGESF
jgi:hypothetical protein